MSMLIDITRGEKLEMGVHIIMPDYSFRLGPNRRTGAR